MTFTIDSETTQALVVKSLVESITPEQREKVITDAISALLEKRPSGDRYRPNNTSLFEDAMSQAINQVARQIFVDEVKNNPEVQERIKTMVTPTIAAICENNWDGLNEKIGQAIGEAVAEWLRNKRWD